MPWTRRMLLPFLVCTVASFVAVAQVPRDFRPTVSILQSAKSDGNLDESKVREALWYAASDLHVAPENLPRILVVHAATEVAKIAQIPLIACTAEHKSCAATLTEHTEDGKNLYYLWLVGKTSDAMLVRGIVQILQLNAGLPETEWVSVARRVLVRMHAVVSAEDLRAG